MVLLLVACGLGIVVFVAAGGYGVIVVVVVAVIVLLLFTLLLRWPHGTAAGCYVRRLFFQPELSFAPSSVGGEKLQERPCSRRCGPATPPERGDRMVVVQGKPCKENAQCMFFFRCFEWRRGRRPWCSGLLMRCRYIDIAGRCYPSVGLRRLRERSLDCASLFSVRSKVMNAIKFVSAPCEHSIPNDAQRIIHAHATVRVV